MDDLISRAKAIDALNGEIEITGRANAEAIKGYVRLVKDRLERLPTAQPEIIHCKHYRTTGAFRVPLHKEEYFCDADNYLKNDPGEKQTELPEWWFCAGAERRIDERSDR